MTQLSTLAATISATGISAPSFEEILSSLQATFQSIYGSDVVLDPSSQDGQMLAVFADAQNDSNNATIGAYNNFSPATAQGVGLSSVVKINGLQREASSNSTAVITVVGQGGTVIPAGLVGDDQNLGTVWALPLGVLIPNTGSANVTATCTTPGAVSAASGTLTQILNPTLGWQSATNASNAAPGAPVEKDAELRQRQSVSTSLPAQSVIGGVYGTVANLPGVSRLAIYENDSNSTDGNGVPAHSISVVVQGGSATAIAQAIEQKKTPGTGTYGSTSELVLDPIGVPVVINFFVLSLVTITVGVNIRELNGYVASTGTLIQQVVVAAINAFAIGGLVYVSDLYAPARLSGDIATATTGQLQTALDALAATYQLSSITISRVSNIPDTTATNGPYSAGTTVITVASVADLYIGAPVGIVLDNATVLNTTVSAIVVATNTVTLNNAVPVSRQILTGANVYLTADVKIAFNEAANTASADVTVTAT